MLTALFVLLLVVTFQPPAAHAREVVGHVVTSPPTDEDFEEKVAIAQRINKWKRKQIRCCKAGHRLFRVGIPCGINPQDTTIYIVSPPNHQGVSERFEALKKMRKRAIRKYEKCYPNHVETVLRCCLERKLNILTKK